MFAAKYVHTDLQWHVCLCTRGSDPPFRQNVTQSLRLKMQHDSQPAIKTLALVKSVAAIPSEQASSPSLKHSPALTPLNFPNLNLLRGSREMMSSKRAPSYTLPHTHSPTKERDHSTPLIMKLWPTELKPFAHALLPACVTACRH